MRRKMKNGLFIVFDGIDGSGKSSQISILVNTLRDSGYEVVQSREPTNGHWGSLVRASAKSGRLPFDEELEYLIKDRQEHIKNVIKPALKEGKIVLLDRYYYSTIAYQGSRCNDAGAIKDIVLSQKFLVPDLTIVFDIQVPIALSRIKNKRGDIPNEFEKSDALEAVRKIYLELCTSQSEIIKIDSNKSEIAIQNEILKLFNEVLLIQKSDKTSCQHFLKDTK